MRKNVQRGFGRGERPYVVEWRFLKRNIWTDWRRVARYVSEEEAERERKRIESRANLWVVGQVRVRKIEMPWMRRRLDYRR